MADEPKGMKPKKPKGRNAFANRGMVEKNISGVIELLTNLHIALKDMDAKPPKSNNVRSMISGVPSRLQFERYGLQYYVDFTIGPSTRTDECAVEGRIIYGVSRTLCFRDCVRIDAHPPEQDAQPPEQDAQPPEQDDGGVKKACHKENRCDRISRCDGLEDKPLISFSVNKNGLIRSSGELEGEWWVGATEGECCDPITEGKPSVPIKKLADLHYRALDHIWQDALDWTNENILP